MKYKKGTHSRLEESPAKFESSNKNFYKLFRDPYRNSSMSNLDYKVNDTLTNTKDTNKIEEVFLAHFNDKFRDNSPPQSNTDIDTEITSSQIDNFCEKYNITIPSIDSVTSNELDTEITNEDIRNGVSLLNKNSSPGQDGVQSKLVIHLYNNIPHVLNVSLRAELNNPDKEINKKLNPMWQRKIILLKK